MKLAGLLPLLALIACAGSPAATGARCRSRRAPAPRDHRQIVEHFGGRIDLRTDTDQGACFEFTLPWTVPEQAATTTGPETSHDDEDPDRRR